MCGRFVAVASVADIVATFRVQSVLQEPLPSYNVAPSRRIGAVAERSGPSGDVERVLFTPRWGLVPSWTKDPSRAPKPINARVETVASKPSFAAALASRRCLIPALGYYEWQQTQLKTPFFIQRTDGEPFAFAGLYEWWRPEPEAAWQASAAIITREAQGAASAVHHRMPLVVPESAWDVWLSVDFSHKDLASELAGTFGVPDVTLREVSTRVNKVAHDGPDLILPAGA